MARVVIYRGNPETEVEEEEVDALEELLKVEVETTNHGEELDSDDSDESSD